MLERVEHGLLTVSFIVLAYTGFALHYPDGWWAHPLLRFRERLSNPWRGAPYRRHHSCGDGLAARADHPV